MLSMFSTFLYSKRLVVEFQVISMRDSCDDGFSKDGSIKKIGMGPSKNYVTSRGGEGVGDFATYRYVYLRGRRVFDEIVT